MLKGIMHIIDSRAQTHPVRLNNVNNAKLLLITWGKIVNSSEITGKVCHRLSSSIEIVDIAFNLLI